VPPGTAPPTPPRYATGSRPIGPISVERWGKASIDLITNRKSHQPFQMTRKR